MSAPVGWGPSHQRPRRGWRRSPPGIALAAFALALWFGVAWYLLAGIAALVIVALGCRDVWRWMRPKLLGVERHAGW